MSSFVQINELRLRASGLTREQARLLGETVAKRLAEFSLAGTQSRRIPALTVRVGTMATSSVDVLATEIARRIRHNLG